ncbi:HTH-type transcriptional regulator GltC [Paenibacillus allorhizosphaerae]|uniref:HTH-type transcriptional regulator GltC n=2 Tax=Paenibacillus allorhizosphaerae TaxID=2849866 RepID=A0ABM8VPD5_9BACL|nr:HTH-type transcriptional regulator GltC [Paenibacillus allorhizosphaerae]
MEWQQIEYFIAVAQLQHMTNAAKELSLTQSALSRSISALEKELGVALFERSGRSLVLNRYGRIFLERAKLALMEIEKGKQEITNLINPSAGVISLSFLHMLGAQLIPSLLNSFRERYADIRFELHQSSNNELLTLISNNDCDFGITTPEFVNDSFHWHLMGKSELFLATPLNHRWVNLSSVNLEELREVPYVGLKTSCGLSFTINKLFEKKQIRPNTVFHADELDTVAGLVSAGFGVAILPKTLGLQNHPLVWLKVDEPECELTLGVVWKKNKELTPVSNIFLSFIREKYSTEC